MSAASFLGISGSIALYGYDGFLYSIGFLVAWLVALLLVAELLRNSGRYTMADQLAYRMRQTPVRSAAATSTIVVSIFYLLAQMVGAGSLVGLLLGVDPPVVKNLVIVGVGVLMIIYVTIGGMKGTTWVQIVKAVLLMAGTLLITILVLAEFGFSLSELLGRRRGEDRQGRGVPATRPALRQGPGGQVRLLVARAGPGAGHRRPAAHPDPLLHHADRERRPQVGALGDRPDRRLLPDDPGARASARRRWSTPARRARSQTSSGNAGVTAAGPGGGRWRGHARRVGPAGVDLRRRVRHDPGGGRRAHPDLGLLGGPRPVRQRVQEGQGDGEAGAAGGPDRRLRHRHRGDRAGHPGAAAEHRLPGGAGVRRRRLGQPARAAVQPVLAAVQHHGGDA